jgi:hypothetical protein
MKSLEIPVNSDEGMMACRPRTSAVVSGQPLSSGPGCERASRLIRSVFIADAACMLQTVEKDLRSPVQRRWTLVLVQQLQAGVGSGGASFHLKANNFFNMSTRAENVRAISAERVGLNAPAQRARNRPVKRTSKDHSSCARSATDTLNSRPAFSRVDSR